MHEKRGYLISIVCLALCFCIVAFGEALFSHTLAKVLLYAVGVVGFLAQLDAMQILNLDRLFEAMGRLVRRHR